MNKAGYTANKQSLPGGQGQYTEGQSISGQGLYFGWAGAVFVVGRRCYTQKSQIQFFFAASKILRDRQTD